MDIIEFTYLADGVYEFKTYMDETITGIPYTDSLSGFTRCFVIPFKMINEHNDLNLSIEQKIEKGILIQINPDVIDEFDKIR